MLLITRRILQKTSNLSFSATIMFMVVYYFRREKKKLEQYLILLLLFLAGISTKIYYFCSVICIRSISRAPFLVFFLFSLVKIAQASFFLLCFSPSSSLSCTYIDISQ